MDLSSRNLDILLFNFPSLALSGDFLFTCNFLIILLFLSLYFSCKICFLSQLDHIFEQNDILDSNDLNDLAILNSQLFIQHQIIYLKALYIISTFRKTSIMMTFIWDLIFFSLNGYLSELEENNHNYLDDCKTQTKISIFFSHDEITQCYDFCSSGSKEVWRGGVYPKLCCSGTENSMCIYMETYCLLYII